jgi:hypothetical protein
MALREALCQPEAHVVAVALVFSPGIAQARYEAYRHRCSKAAS